MVRWQIKHIRQSEFRQGRTTRWAIAWTLSLPRGIPLPLVVKTKSHKGEASEAAGSDQAPAAKRLKPNPKQVPIPKSYKVFLSDWKERPIDLVNKLKSALSTCGVTAQKPNAGSEFNFSGIVTLESLLGDGATEFVIDQFSERVMQDAVESLPLPLQLDFDVLQVGSHGSQQKQFQIHMSIAKKQPTTETKTSNAPSLVGEERAEVLAAVHRHVLNHLGLG